MEIFFFDVFVGRTGISTSYSSAILKVPHPILTLTSFIQPVTDVFHFLNLPFLHFPSFVCLIDF